MIRHGSATLDFLIVSTSRSPVLTALAKLLFVIRLCPLRWRMCTFKGRRTPAVIGRTARIGILLLHTLFQMSLRSLVRIARMGVRQCRRVFPRGAVNPIRPYGADDVFGISPLTPSETRMLRIWCAQSHKKFRSVRSVPSVRWWQVCAYLKKTISPFLTCGSRFYQGKCINISKIQRLIKIITACRKVSSTNPAP
jgi:hypothetical protein